MTTQPRTITVRMSEEQHSQILQWANDADLSMNQYILNCIFEEDTVTCYSLPNAPLSAKSKEE